MRFVLKNIEQAIGHALQKIDTTKPDLREKIYQTVWYSHEKTLLVNQNLTQEEKNQRREQLTHLIRTIESHYQSPPPSAIDDIPIVRSPIETKDTHPVLGSAVSELAVSGSAIAGLTNFSPSSQRAPIHQRKRSWLRNNAMMMLLLIILLVVLWSFYNSLVGTRFPFMSQVTPPEMAQNQAVNEGEVAKRGTSNKPFANPPFANPWVRIFDPTDITILSASGRAQIDLRDDDGEDRFVRIHTPTPQDAVIIEIGSGVTALLAEKTAVFELVVRSSLAEVTQLSLTCDFGENINCGRRHFEVLPLKEGKLFRIDMTQMPPTAGRIFIRNDSDLPDSGLDIFDMRVRIE